MPKEIPLNAVMDYLNESDDDAAAKKLRDLQDDEICPKSPDGRHEFATPTSESCKWCGW